MDFVILPHGHFIFYGALVLTCGIALGTVLGRNLLRRRQLSPPEPPDLLRQRMALLEQDLEITAAQLQRFTDERDFMRELRRPRSRAAAA